MMKSYELCALFGGALTPAEIDGQAKQVAALLEAAQAEIRFSQNLGRKKLAYKIAGNAHGEYRSWLFLAEPEAIPNLNEKLRLGSFVARHLITALDQKTIQKRIDKASEAKAVKREITEQQPATVVAAEEPAVAKPAVAEETPRPPTPEIPGRPIKEKTKVSLEDLDKKLDEILENDTI